MIQHSVFRGESLFRRALNWCTSPRVIYWIGEPFFWLLGRRQKTQELALSNVKHVLVVRLDTIGDVILTAPFLRELRRSLPYANITLLVKDNTYDLVELCPYVNEVLTYHSNRRKRFSQFWNHVCALRLAWKYLWKKNFELAIIPRWDADFYHATFVAYFSGANWRVGYSEIVTDNKKQTNAGFDRLLTHILADNMLKHEVERNLDVLRFLGGTIQGRNLEIWQSSKDEEYIAQCLNICGAHLGDLLIAFCPSAREPKRMWPLTNFVDLGSWLKQEFNARIVVVGAHGEEALGEELARQLPGTVINLVGQTTLRQAASLMKNCSLYIGNDTGPKHLAAAAGVPIVELSCHPIVGSPYHSNSPQRFGPWGVPHIVLQPEVALAPCLDACCSKKTHCILGITLEQVLEAVEQSLTQQNFLCSNKKRAFS